MARTVTTRGLLPEIEMRMTVEASLSDAVIKAKAIEKQLTDVKRMRGNNAVKSRMNEKTEKGGSINIVDSEKLRTEGKQTGIGASNPVSCQICGKLGHTAGQCKMGQSAASQSMTMCQLWRKSGHTAINCATIARPTQPATLFVTCQSCSKPGHTADKFLQSPRS